MGLYKVSFAPVSIIFKKISRAGLAQWYRVHLIGERSGFDTRSWKPEMTLGIVAHKQQKSEGDNESILDLKSIGRVT